MCVVIVPSTVRGAVPSPKSKVTDWTAMLPGFCETRAVNVTGVRQAAWTVNVFTVAKLLPLGALVVLGLAWLNPVTLSSQAVADPQWTEAVLLLVFAYGGFESAVVAGSESREPKRDTAFARTAR